METPSLETSSNNKSAAEKLAEINASTPEITISNINERGLPLKDAEKIEIRLPYGCFVKAIFQMKEGVVHVFDISTSDKYAWLQKNGIGERLMRILITEAKKRDIKTLTGKIISMSGLKLFARVGGEDNLTFPSNPYITYKNGELRYDGDKGDTIHDWVQFNLDKVIAK